jgi:hypothetical protein
VLNRLKAAGELNTQTNFSFDIKMLKPESKQWKIIVNCVEIVGFSVGYAQYTDSSNDVRSARKQQQAEGTYLARKRVGALPHHRYRSGNDSLINPASLFTLTSAGKLYPLTPEIIFSI